MANKKDSRFSKEAIDLITETNIDDIDFSELTEEEKKSLINKVGSKLSPVQKRFAHAWIRCHSFEKAGLAAGYGVKQVDNGDLVYYATTTKRMAMQTYEIPHVKRYIEILEEIELAEMNVGRNAIVKDWADTKNASIQDYMTWENVVQDVVNQKGDVIDTVETLKIRYKEPKELTPAQLKNIKSITKDKFGCIKLELYDRQTALIQLGKIVGIYSPEGIEVTGKDGGAIKYEDARESLYNKLEKKFAKTAKTNDTGEEK